MESNTSLEHIRAWAEGTLDAEALARFESRLEADAELRALAEAYRSVQRQSEGLDAPLPESSMSFADLSREIDALEAGRTAGASGFWRAAAIAAGVLVLAGAGWLALGRDAKQPRYAPVALRTIPLSRSELFEELALPATLASYHPISEGRIQWVSEPGEARRIATATGRPLLVFGRFARCQVADEVERSMSDDLDLLALAEECVPMMLELDRMEAGEREALIADGYPCLQLRSADGDEVVPLASEQEHCDLQDRMREGIGSCSVSAACAPWQVSRDLAALCERARECEDAGRITEAHRLYEELIAGAEGGLFSEAGEQGLLRIALAARDALLEARELCEQDLGEAVQLLERAVEQFEATPHVAELALVRDAVRRTGEFPALAWASR